MDNSKALEQVLKEADAATQAYGKAYSDVQQTSSLAQKELKARFDQAEISAKAEAEQIWKKTQQRIHVKFSIQYEDEEISNLLIRADQKIPKVSQELLLELIKE